MRELVEYLVKSLVLNPDEVRVTMVDDRRVAVYQVQVAPDDMGKVIGKQGRIAKALRTLVRAVAARDHRDVVIKILD